MKQYLNYIFYIYSSLIRYLFIFYFLVHNSLYSLFGNYIAKHFRSATKITYGIEIPLTFNFSVQAKLKNNLKSQACSVSPKCP